VFAIPFFGRLLSRAHVALRGQHHMGPIMERMVLDLCRRVAETEKPMPICLRA
jgi:hypothetical protein